MASLYIRDLPDYVYEALAFRAEAEHRTLAQQAIVELCRFLTEPTARERRREFLKELRARIESQPPFQVSRAPEELIREDRER